MLGNNERFFENINEQCIRLEQKDNIASTIRKKYDMLRIILTDDRAKKYGSYSQYRFNMGDENVIANGFFECGANLINIPIGEIERMGECFLSNPGTEIPKDFYSENVRKEILSIRRLKEKAQVSKQPLNLINRAYESIRNIIRARKISKEQGEGER